MISALTKQESSAISHLRVLAMLSIVTCHFLQALNNQWAWVLNIGVQIFLFMSGFLYGHKHIDNWLNWFEKRITRVYIPFLLFFIAVIPLYAFSKLISFKNIVSYILDLQWFTGGVKGLGHLWFLTAIAICYAITPVLQWSKKIGNHLIWLSVIAVISILVLHPPFYNHLLWIALYVFGYYIATTEKYERSIFLVLAIGVMVWLLTDFSWDKMINMDCTWSITFHITGAVIIFFVGLLLFNLLKIEQTTKPVKILDKYSFQIYIVHHIIIMQPFSMLNITENIVFNIGIILLYIAFYTFVLTIISNKVTEIVDQSFIRLTK
ncbi:MAG: acyltransferase [Bacteroidales bacterium]|nr:acyltransferase [Bacteroidales bacterium]